MHISDTCEFTQMILLLLKVPEIEGSGPWCRGCNHVALRPKFPKGGNKGQG